MNGWWLPGPPMHAGAPGGTSVARSRSCRQVLLHGVARRPGDQVETIIQKRGFSMIVSTDRDAASRCPWRRSSGPGVGRCSRARAAGSGRIRRGRERRGPPVLRPGASDLCTALLLDQLDDFVERRPGGFLGDNATYCERVPFIGPLHRCVQRCQRLRASAWYSLRSRDTSPNSVITVRWPSRIRTRSTPLASRTSSARSCAERRSKWACISSRISSRLAVRIIRSISCNGACIARR